MERAKSIDELYDEVKDFDLVICNDAPLALALNNRLDRPRVGIFAITPRQLAGDLAIDILGGPLISDIDIVRKIAKKHGYPLRFVHGEIENFKTISRYTTEVRKYIRGKKSRYVFDDFTKYNTLELAMQSFKGADDPYFSGKKIAVIGIDMFDELDKNFIPRDYEEITVIDYKHNHEYSDFRVLSSDHEMAENAVNLIEEETAMDFAIVMDVNGKIADAVRSELYRKGIPFINSLSIRDLNDIRDYLEFIDRSLKFETTRVHQIRELLRSYGGSIYKKYDEYLIANLPEKIMNDRTKDLLSVMRDIRNMKYGDVCEKILRKDTAQVMLMLKQLELTDGYITDEDTADMYYAVNNFELKHNEQIPPTEKEGVLLVDCKNSVYIDRPVIIYLGLGQEWEKDLSDLDLTDRHKKPDINEMNVLKFKILMQQGTSRIYICNSIRNGKEAKPCSYFEQADRKKTYEEDDNNKIIYKSFSDIVNCISGPWHKFEEKPMSKFGSMMVHQDLIDFEFSSSSFNNYIRCPRGFMFKRIVKSPDNENTLIGDYLHDYIEFRSCYPEKCQELGTEYFVKFISERCSPLYTKDLRELRESKIRNAVVELDRLAERYHLHEGVKIVPKARKEDDKNEFFDLVGMGDYGSDCSEVDISSKERHMHGIMDYVKGSVIFDFKTGSKKVASKIRENMVKEKPDWGPDFQCLFYLSLLEDKGVKDPEFTFFSTSANEMNAITGITPDPEDAMVHVKLVGNKVRFVRENFQFDDNMQAKAYLEIREKWDDFMAILDDIGIENAIEYDDNMLVSIIERMGMKPGKTRKDLFAKALGYLKKAIETKMYIQENTIFVSSGDLEDFRNLVRESYEAVISGYNSIFEIDPRMDCKNCDCKDLCIPVQEED